MTQPREAVADAGEHVGRAVTALDISGVDNGPDEQALGLGEDVALSAFDLFACVIAAWPAALGRFDALAVSHACRWRSFVPGCFTQPHQQHMIDRRP